MGKPNKLVIKPNKLLLILGVIAVGVLLSASLQAAAIEGTTTAVFNNPAYEANGAPYGSGAGTNSFSWGDPAAGSATAGQSSLTFNSYNFSGEFGTSFVLGILDFTNGSIEKDSGALSIDLDATLTFTAPTGTVETVNATLDLVNTYDVGSPLANSDSVTLPTEIDDIVFIVDGMVYTLEILGFGNVTSGGGITTTSSFYVQEGQSSSAEIIGLMTCEAIPASPSILLALFGSIGTFLVSRRRK